MPFKTAAEILISGDPCFSIVVETIKTGNFFGRTLPVGADVFRGDDAIGVIKARLNDPRRGDRVEIEAVRDVFEIEGTPRHVMIRRLGMFIVGGSGRWGMQDISGEEIRRTDLEEVFCVGSESEIGNAMQKIGWPLPRNFFRVK